MQAAVAGWSGPPISWTFGTSQGWHLDRLERIKGVEVMSGTLTYLSALAIRW
jgi:hypothetical protein